MLSNILGAADGDHKGPRPPGRAEIRPARGAEVDAALAIILGTPDTPAAGSRVHDFIALAAQRGIDLDFLWAAVRDRRVLTAALPVFSPGHTVLIFAPRQAQETSLLSAVLEEVCQAARRRGVLLAQALLDLEDSHLHAVFAANAFTVMAELHYLHMLLRGEFPEPLLPPGFSWQSYRPQTHAFFSRAIQQTYRDSLDCPALSGLRDIEDVITGHKASGEFDGRLWQALVEETPDGPRALGVILLGHWPQSDTADLVYLGLVPEARARRVGRVPVKVSGLLMHQAMAVARAHGWDRLSLAVDAHNVPALKLYYRHGLDRTAAKLAVMRDLRKPLR